MFISKLAISRRTMLRGMGAAIALPLLDAMVPAFTPLAKAAAAPRTRFGAIYIPNGAIVDEFFPKSFGTNWDFTPILKPLEPFKNQLLVVKNLTRSHPGSQVGDHAVSVGGYLTGVWPKRTEAEDVLANTTIDQVLAGKIGQASQFPSVEFATEDYTGYVGGCTPGYSCAYQNTISWATPTTPLPMEINPRTAFERLFGDGGSEESRRRIAQEDRSILDSIAGEARQLQRRLAPQDRTRVTDYLDHVREIERRIQKSETQHATALAVIDKPLGIPDSFVEHTALMFDLLAMALQADQTRVFTFMMSREGSQRTFGEIDVADPWHVVSHHGDQAEKVARAAKINVLCVSMFAKFIEKLKATPDGDGTLLDHSLMFYGSGMGNSNVHATDPLPMLAMGGGVGKGNRHIILPPKTEIGNLWLAVANRFDVPMEKFGESNGAVELF